jgi:hypothetical protein
MRDGTLAVFHEGAAYPRLEAWARRGGSAPRKLVLKIANFVRNQRNPRNLSYMVALAQERFAGPLEIVSIPAGPSIPAVAWSEAREVVLLWPDPTGIGWRKIEAECRRRVPRQTTVWVLNGRRRQFPFDSPIFRKMRRRRWMETSLVFQTAFALAAFTGAPLLWLADLLRGKK